MKRKWINKMQNCYRSKTDDKMERTKPYWGESRDECLDCKYTLLYIIQCIMMRLNNSETLCTFRCSAPTSDNPEQLSNQSTLSFVNVTDELPNLGYFFAAFPCGLRLFPVVGRSKLPFGTTRLTPVDVSWTCLFWWSLSFFHTCSVLSDNSVCSIWHVVGYRNHGVSSFYQYNCYTIREKQKFISLAQVDPGPV